jgi:hypothetical protein
MVVAKPIEDLVAFPQPVRPEGDALGMVQEDYCKLRGYDHETGVPIRDELEKLGMKDVADKLDSVVGEIPKKETVNPSVSSTGGDLSFE